ncbi:AbrB/MazE/SpoVT family DNA-binding domain-containing protein [Bacillus cereus]|uniref:SpoVT-AbrB domain-containing protein n=1 Tax=Bacillus cereus VD184 TaxID=1053242 RepID=A0A9W5R1Z5_BACCE|nr:AbrB/MazE/SpoVT family DNA-binding domain-containing protein [Bacillus cereus]EOQ04912.1 hypothetical protein IKC_06289 [Bacillus cereus VD184]
MKYTGMQRKVDNAGRVVLPAELRNLASFSLGTQVEVSVEGIFIRLKRHSMACNVTGEVSEDNLVLADGKIVLSPNGAKYVLVQLKKYIR